MFICIYNNVLIYYTLYSALKAFIAKYLNNYRIICKRYYYSIYFQCTVTNDCAESKLPLMNTY